MTVRQKMTNCPSCQKPILNGGVFMSAAEFNMRCPSCQTTLGITIEPKISVAVLKPANGAASRFKNTPSAGVRS